MKLLFVSDFEENPNSGAAGSLITIGRNIQKLGHTVDYIWKKTPLLIKNPNYSRFLELPSIQYKQVKEALSHTEYDVVSISQPHAWLAVKRLKKLWPKTLFINRTHGWELRIHDALKKLPVTQQSVTGQLKGLPVYMLLKHCSYVTTKYSDAVICASSDDANYIKAAYPQYADKIYCVSYGLDETFVHLEQGEKTNEKIKFLYVGQYVDRKGINDIIEAFKKIKHLTSFELTFVIDKESLTRVKNDFAFLDAAQLTILSWMNRNDLIQLYKAHDVFLMPSYGEGFGKTTFEAMAAGLCVIGYTEGALTDFGVHNKNALLSNVGDRNDFFENIKFAINNLDDIKAFGLQASADVQSQTWERNAVETMSLFNKLLSSKLSQQSISQ